MPLLRLLPILASLLIAPPLQAQVDPAEEAPPSRFQQIVDTDGDGLVSATESERFAETRFGRLDVDNDGAVSRAEFLGTLQEAHASADEATRPRLARAIEQRETVLRDLDKDRDGGISRNEFLSDARARFADADRDKDGRLTPDELRAARSPF